MTEERYRRNQRVAECLLSCDGSPLHPMEWLMQMAVMPVEELAAALGCDRLQAWQEKRLAANGVQLFVHQHPDLPSRVSNIIGFSAAMTYARLVFTEADAAKWTTEHPAVNLLVQEGVAIAIRFLRWMDVPAKLTQVTRESILAMARSIAADETAIDTLGNALEGRILPDTKVSLVSPVAPPARKPGNETDPQIPSAPGLRPAMVERLRKLAAAKQPTDAQRKLLEHSAAIFGTPATPNDAAYMPRELVQITLPHKNPRNVPAWTRRNGNRSVIIQPGWNTEKNRPFGYPYGTIPRLLLYWITTEAKRTGERLLKLGSSLSDFMAQLGLNSANGSSGAKRSDARRLRDQTQYFFNASISFVENVENDERKGTRWLNMPIARKGELWWSRKNPDQGALFGSWIELGEDFYAAVIAHPVPVDMRALKALKQSSLALDLYAWLCFEAFRAHRSGNARFETWGQLHAHLGAGYKNPADFRRRSKTQLRKIQAVYPGLRLGDRQGGIQVRPESWTAIQPREMTIDGVCRTL